MSEQEIVRRIEKMIVHWKDSERAARETGRHDMAVIWGVYADAGSMIADNIKAWVEKETTNEEHPRSAD